MSTENQEQDSSNNKVEALAAELSKANRTIQSLEREKRRVGLSFHRIPESGYQISRLWEGDFPYLQKLPSYSYEKTPEDPTFRADANTVLIEADNLAALMTLQLTHKGKIDVIYIDPPYNTGNEDFIYNDARKSSLKDVEGIEASDYEETLDGKARTVGKDDPERHSLWLSFMERRLWLAKDLLSPTGVIFVSIDDNEQARLKMLMDSVFGESNFVDTIIWEKTYSTRNDAKHFSRTHDFIIVYRKTENWERALLPRTEKANAHYKYDDQDGRGSYRTGDISVARSTPSSIYPVLNPNNGISFSPPPGRAWGFSKEKMAELISDNKIYWGKDGKTGPQLKRYLRDVQDGMVPQTIWKYSDVGHTDEGAKEVKDILSGGSFDYPKPTRLIKQIASLHPNKNAIILDFFAGSGTTAHAVAELNKEDGGNRQCILVTHGDENGKNIAADITAERMKRVLSGENWADGKEHESMPGSLYYYKLLFAPKTTNPLTALETMQSRFVGIASLEQDAHVQMESETNYAVLRNGHKIVIVWKNEEALLDEPESEFIPLMKRLKAEHPDLEHIVYTPSNQSSLSDEYGTKQYGWVNYSYPMEYLENHAGLLNRMKRNKTMLAPFNEKDTPEENHTVEAKSPKDSPSEVSQIDSEDSTVYFSGEAK